MRFGVLGVIWSDWTDVNYERVAFARELGFSGIGAHLTVPASTISDEVSANVRDAIDGNGMDFLQLWGPYPTIISEDEAVRRAAWRERSTSCAWQRDWACRRLASAPPATIHAATGGRIRRTTARPARIASCAASRRSSRWRWRRA